MPVGNQGCEEGFIPIYRCIQHTRQRILVTNKNRFKGGYLVKRITMSKHDPQSALTVYVRGQYCQD